MRIVIVLMGLATGGYQAEWLSKRDWYKRGWWGLQQEKLVLELLN